MTFYRVCRSFFVVLLVVSLVAQPSHGIAAAGLYPDPPDSHNCRVVSVDLGRDVGLSIVIGDAWQLRIRF